MPCEWLRLIRNSMMNLAPQFSSNRMVREYVEQFYHPAAIDFKKRRAKRGELAKQLHHWYSTLQSHWEQIHFGNIKIDKREHGWSFRIPVYLGEILPVQIRVELYADGVNCETFQVTQRHYQEKITGAVHGYSYRVEIETTRPATDFTARVIPHHPEA